MQESAPNGLPEWLYRLMEASWPAARKTTCGPFLLRAGAGGGKRVEAASCHGPFNEHELEACAAGMRAEGKAPLFFLGPDDQALDQALAARGYRIIDPVIAYQIATAPLAAQTPAHPILPHWPPLAASRALWAEGGIGPARLAVMARVQGPKTALLALSNARLGGLGFVACAGQEAMLHALEVRQSQRRKGVARALLQAAAAWAQDHGARRLSLLVTAQNSAACALYAGLGMEPVARYHYRLYDPAL